MYVTGRKHKTVSVTVSLEGCLHSIDVGAQGFPDGTELTEERDYNNGKRWDFLKQTVLKPASEVSQTESYYY